MVLKKRGFLVVVVLVILMSFSGLAGWTGHCPAEQCVSIVVGITDCPFCDEGPGGVVDVSCEDPEPDDDEQGECQSFEENHGDLQILLTDTEDICGIGPSYPPQTQAHQPGGCWFVVGEHDTSSEDECGVGRVRPGVKWGNGYVIFEENYFSREGINEEIDHEAELLLETVYTDEPWEYICSDNGYWEKCYSSEHLEKKIVAKGATYECIFNADTGAYVWVTDQDGDGYTTSEDCDDDASDDYLSSSSVADGTSAPTRSFVARS